MREGEIGEERHRETWRGREIGQREREREREREIWGSVIIICSRAAGACSYSRYVMIYNDRHNQPHCVGWMSCIQL